MPRDTSRQAYAVLVDELRRAGPDARVLMAADMSDAVRDLSVAGIRRQHPEFNDTQVEEALVERLFGTAAREPRA